MRYASSPITNLSTHCNYSALCETVLFKVHPIQAYLHVLEPPSRQERQGKIFCFAGFRKEKTEPSISLLSNTKNVKDEVQSFFFDQNRVEVLVKAVFHLPLPGK